MALVKLIVLIALGFAILISQALFTCQYPLRDEIVDRLKEHQK